MTEQSWKDVVKQMPKVELHKHLEGTIRFETLVELAQHKGLTDAAEMKHENALRKHFLIETPATSLTEVLTKFWNIQSMFETEDVVERVAYEMVADASAENIRLLEIRYSPNYVGINHPQLTYDKTHKAVIRGIERAKLQFPNVAVGVIGIIDRNLPIVEATQVHDFILQNKSTFVGVDLANDEIKFPSKPFAELFQNLKREGLHVTVHAGEVDTVESATNVYNAIEFLGAERIGHGIHVHRDQKVIEYAKNKGTVFEVCPSSNVLVGSSKDLISHPVRGMIDCGLNVTISSDDPGLFGMTLSEEYCRLLKSGALKPEDLKRCNEIAAKASFIDASEKERCWFSHKY